METALTRKSHQVLFVNTFAFTICFAVWMMNGVLVTYLTDNGIFKWSLVEIGWLLGVPVLTGSIFRLPIGLLTDKFGGKWVFSALLIFCSIPTMLLSQANSYQAFLVLSFLFGLIGTSFAVGIGFTSVWYPKSWQGRALGIFGMGNAGSALTTLIAPTLLNRLTENGNNPEGWRMLPVYYGAALLVMGLVFLFFIENKKPENTGKTLKDLLSPLKNIRVWRFGLYYFLVFGCFVAYAQWLVPYFVNVYHTSLVLAGLLASSFSLPSGVIRALGGWLSDKFGARKVMYWVLGSSALLSLLLMIPRMELSSPGAGIMALKSGKVIAVNDSIVQIDETIYPVKAKIRKITSKGQDLFIFPVKDSWHEPIVKVGDVVKKKQLLASGITRIYFQANISVFVILLILIGISWGIGKAAVYKHIPEYFPNEVGVVGGMVGMIGGLGGFVGPILFGYLLAAIGLWTSSWMLILFISIVCLIWMNNVVTRMMKKSSPQIADKMEYLPEQK